MRQEAVALFHDPPADQATSAEPRTADQRPQPERRPACRTTRQYADHAAARAAALEAVVRDLRTLERATATRGANACEAPLPGRLSRAIV